MDITNELLKALVTATDQRKEAALRVLNGDPNVFPDPKKPEPFITLKAVGRQLGVSACSLWRWGVPGHDLGGRRRFRMSEVEAYLNSNAFKRRAKELQDDRRQWRSHHAGDND